MDKLFLPGLLKLKRLIDGGFFGRILSVRGEFGYWVFEGDWQTSQRPSWNYRVEDGGGITLDMFPHWSYVLEFLFGRVRSVYAQTATHIPVRVDEGGSPYDATADDASYALFELDGGVVAQINSSWAVRVFRDELVEFQMDGTLGCAVAGLQRCRVQHRSATPKPVWNPDLQATEPFREQWQEIPDNDVFDNGFKSSGSSSSGTSTPTSRSRTRCGRGSRRRVGRTGVRVGRKGVAHRGRRGRGVTVLALPQPDGSLVEHTVHGPRDWSLPPARPGRGWRSRPRTWSPTRTPTTLRAHPPMLDWDATLAFRAHRSDTVWASPRRWTPRSAGWAYLGHDTGADHPQLRAGPRPRWAHRLRSGHRRGPARLDSLDEVVAAYLEQLEVVEGAGAQAILMASRSWPPLPAGRRTMRSCTARCSPR